MNETLAAWAPRVLSVLRIYTGLVLLAHGTAKILGFPVVPTFANVQINSLTGALVAAPGSPFSAFNLDFVHVLAVDGTGNFVYAGQGLPALPIYAFSIDQNTGALS